MKNAHFVRFSGNGRLLRGEGGTPQIRYFVCKKNVRWGGGVPPYRTKSATRVFHGFPNHSQLHVKEIYVAFYSGYNLQHGQQGQQG